MSNNQPSEKSQTPQPQPGMSNLPTYEYFHDNLNYCFLVDQVALTALSISPLSEDLPPAPEPSVSPVTPEQEQEDPPQYTTERSACINEEGVQPRGINEVPSTEPLKFSPAFNFNQSLLKIFWRIDLDHNNRVNKDELAKSLQCHYFKGDEETLAWILLQCYELICPAPMLTDQGLSISQILNFPAFEQLSQESPPSTLITSTTQSNRLDHRQKKQQATRAILFKNQLFRR